MVLPRFGAKQAILNNAINFAWALGISILERSVGFIEVSAKMPDTIDAAA